jgi:hypothetical protein
VTESSVQSLEILMKNYRVLAINAKNVVPLTELSKRNDRGVKGVYSVEVEAGLPGEKQAAVALDVFHSSVPVGMPDDFTFTVFDPESGQTLAQDLERADYSGSASGRNLRKESNRAENLYEIEVIAIGDDSDRTDLGSKTIVARNRAAARTKASAVAETLWDNRLDAASCTRVVKVNRLEH